MMQKYGVENAASHFMSFNTICDATQVSTFCETDSRSVFNLTKVKGSTV